MDALYLPPDGAPFKKTILKRAEIRVDLLMSKGSRKNLPALPGLSFEMIKFSAPGMKADQVCRNMRVYRGNGVKTTVLSVNSDLSRTEHSIGLIKREVWVREI